LYKAVQSISKDLLPDECLQKLLGILTSFVKKNATINKFTAHNFMMLAQAFIYETCNEEETAEDDSGGLFCYMYGPLLKQINR